MSQFDGLRIIDLGTVWTVPLATKLFALLGAEVIKVEAPNRLDVTRFGDHADNQPIGKFWETGGRYHSLNLNKKNVTLDLTQPEGREVFESLVKVSDIVAEQFSPRVMVNLGYDYPSLQKLKPDIIMLSVNAFGHDGPWKDYRAFGPGIDTLSGLTSVTGYTDGTPVITSATFTDIMAGLNAFIACSAALHFRKRTGKGQWVKLSLMESTTFCLAEPIIDFSINQRVKTCQGNQHNSFAPHGCYRCPGSDKWLAIAVTSDEQWHSFCQAIGRPAWVQDKKFRSSSSRWENRDELNRLVEAWTITREHREAMHSLQKWGVPAGAVLNAKEVLLDSHLRAREHFQLVQFPQIHGMEHVAKRPHMGLPWKMTKKPAMPLTASPLLGEHNYQVLAELLGMSPEDVSQLYKSRVMVKEPADTEKWTSLLRPYPLDLLKERGRLEDYDTDYKKILGI